MQTSGLNPDWLHKQSDIDQPFIHARLDRICCPGVQRDLYKRIFFLISPAFHLQMRKQILKFDTIHS